MATKLKRILALVIALALCAGQIAVPVMAEGTDSSQNVTVNVDLSQAPDANSGMNVTTGEPVTVTGTPEDGVTEQKTSTTTNWSGTDASGAAVSGSETVSSITGIDDVTGDTLYEIDSFEGNETSVKTETSTEKETLENQVIDTDTEEFSVTETSGIMEDSTTNTTVKTEEGDWEYEEREEGTPITDLDLSDEESTSAEMDVEIPDPGEVTIDLTPNDKDGTTITEIIPIEDVLAGIVVLPQSGEYTELLDENGNVIGYEVVTTTVTNDTTTTISAPTTTEKTYTVPAEVTLPEGVAAGTEPVYGEDGVTVIGEVVTEIVPQYDAAGKVIKYTITKTTSIDLEDSFLEESQDETTQTSKNDSTIHLPQKPDASVITDPDTGYTTTVSVDELKDADGNVIGYTLTTTLTDEDGRTLSTTTEKQYGTVVTTQETTTVDPTTIETVTKSREVTTEVTEITAEATITEKEMVTERLNEYIETSMTEREYAYVEIEGKLYFLYTGSMTVSEGQDHGDISLMNPVTPMESLMNSNSSLDLDAGGDNVVKNPDEPDEGFLYVGHGIDTALNISKGDSSSDVVQFRLLSEDGKEYYALCIDFNTTIEDGHLYDIQDITSEDYYQQSGSVDIETAEKIRSVALNGYWGTANDVGSMADVQAFLKAYLTGTLKMTETKANGIINSLTPGQALAATQAALWKFGNKDGGKVVNEDNLVPNGWFWWTKTEDYTNTEYLYDALLAAANDPNAELEADEGVEFLDKEDITGGAITVKSKVISEDGKHANNDDNADNDIYNTDISFTLGIEPSKLNGDLIVTVTVDGKEQKYRLAGENVIFPLTRITADENGVYTIPNVEIAEGVTINLNLSGTQDLGTGVYIYTSLEGDFNDSQTLVTLATGNRKVNLDMNMTFNVEEPDATATMVEGSETTAVKTVDTQKGTKKDREIVTSSKTTTQTSITHTSEGTIQKTVYADVTIEKITTEETRNERSWLASWLKPLEVVPLDVDEGSEPTDPDPTDPVVVDETPNKDVTVAKAPKTGDISMIWVILSGLSAGGVLLLNRKRED